MSVGKIFNSGNSIAFKGYDKYLDEKGKEQHKFYYPHSKDYDLQVEVATRLKNGEKLNVTTYDVKKDSLSVSIPKNIDSRNDVFYRFKLVPNNPDAEDKTPIYATDNGLISDLGEVNGSEAPFNRIFADRKIVSKSGRMQLQLPDMYYPGVEYTEDGFKINQAKRASVLSTLRNHVNKMGGTINGMIYKLPEKAAEGYTRIVGTPFTKDDVSSHLYWTQNAYQMSAGLGGLQDMKRFQQALFKNGMNFITDAALINEGLQGIHFSSVMKWGEKSPFFNWFKTYDLDSSLLTLGVIPAKSENVRMKIINSPVKTEANPVPAADYDPKKPTIVQLYDARLASPEQVKSNKVFNRYDSTTANHYEITQFDDAIIPYSFEVNPEELAKNIKKFNATEPESFADADTIMNVLNFSKFRVGERKEGGIELWDGNVDIAKLNFSLGNYDISILNKGSEIDAQKRFEAYKQGIREVQDYAVLSGNYWAKSFADTQLEYAASAFKNVKNAQDAIDEINNNTGVILPKNLAKSVNKQNVINVMNGEYNLFKLNNITKYTKIDEDDRKESATITTYDDLLKKSIMNLPLEVLEAGDDVVSILSSGYLTKRAGTNEQIGLSRFDIYKSNYPNLPQKYSKLYKKMDEILTTDLYKFADKVLTAYENFDGSEKIKDGNNLTTFGKYAINAVASDLTKYALLKALNPEAQITVEKDGTLNFDNIDRNGMIIKALGIQASSPEDEAANLVKKFEKGISKLANNQEAINKMALALQNRLKGLNANSFMLADMICDRTESGMGLRVDAAKDIAAFDSVRDEKDSIAKAWNDVVGFWTKYVKEGIHKENPHAFATAEVTDVASFINQYPVEDLKSAPEAERKLLQETGATSIANYSYFFSMPIGMYSRSPEDGAWDGFKNVTNIKSKVDCLDTPGWFDNSGLIYEGMPDSSIHSYTFVGNHDKPRILHVLGLDMGLYNSSFDGSDESHNKAALDVLNISEGLNYESLPVGKDGRVTISAPAIAMGKRIKDVFRDMKAAKKISDDDFSKIENSISKLARGIYNIDGSEDETYFNADSFGEKPFDVVLNDVITTANLSGENDRKDKIKDEAFERMLAPAIQKFKCIYKMLTLLPGDPTDFAGDKEGMTGFESKCKNITQQNRNAIRWEWLDESNPQYKPFVAKYKADINGIMALRMKPELSALNNGHTVSLVNYSTLKELLSSDTRKYSANFRYNAEGSQVITIFGQPDLKNPDPAEFLGDKKVEINSIYLSKARSREGLSAGLTEGTIFKNANEADKSVYKVCKEIVKMPKAAPAGTPKSQYVAEKDGVGYIIENVESYVLKRFIGKNQVPIRVGKNDDNAIVLYCKN